MGRSATGLGMNVSPDGEHDSMYQHIHGLRGGMLPGHQYAAAAPDNCSVEAQGLLPHLKAQGPRIYGTKSPGTSFALPVTSSWVPGC